MSVPAGAPRLVAICAAVWPLSYRLDESGGFVPNGVLVQVVDEPDPPVSHQVSLSVSLLGLTPELVWLIPLELWASAFSAFFSWPGGVLGGAASADPVRATRPNVSDLWIRGYARSWAPKRSAKASVMRPRSPAASSSVSVRSGDRKLAEKAIDFFPGPTCSPR